MSGTRSRNAHRKDANPPFAKRYTQPFTADRLQLYVEHFGLLMEVGGQIGWMANAAGEVEIPLPSWTTFTGQSFEELRGAGWLDALYPPDRDLARDLMTHWDHSDAINEGIIRLRRCDGRIRQMQVRAKPVLRDGLMAHFVASCVDITEQWRAERLASGETKIMRLILANQPLATVLRELIVTMESVIHEAIGCLSVAHDGLLFTNTAPHLPAAVIAASQRLPIAPNAGSCGAAAYTRETVIVTDIENDPRWELYRAIVQPFGLRACWSVPILGEMGALLGTVAFYYRERRAPDTGEIEIAQAAAQLAALAFDHARVHHERDELARKEQLARAELETTFDSINDGMLVFDANGHVRRVNHSIQAITGYPAAFFQQTTADRMNVLRLRTTLGEPLPDQLMPVWRVLRGHILEDDGTTNYLLRHRDGADRLINVSGGPLRDAAGLRIGGVLIVRDITERASLAHRVAEQAEQLRAIFDSLSYGLVVLNAHGEMTQANHAAATLIGMDSPQDLMSLSWADRLRHFHLHTLDGAPVPLALNPSRRVLNGETLDGLEAPDLLYHSVAGGEILLNFSGAPMRDEAGAIVGAVLTYRDVTDRRQLEQRVITQADELRAIFDTLTDGLVVVNPQGKILTYNAAFCEMIGAPNPLPEEYRRAATRDNLLRFRYLDGTPVPRSRWVSTRALQGEVISGPNAEDWRVRRLDGKELIVNHTGMPLRDRHGVITEALLILRDVTEARRMDQMREDFINIASHELRAPLTPIILAAALLERRVKTPERYADIPRLTHDIVKHTHLISDLADEMLDLARISSGLFRLTLAECALSDCLLETLADARLSLDREIRLAMAAPATRLWLDSRRLRQVVMNLLTNAAKYSPNDTPIDVSAGVTARDDRRELTLSVRDYGVGIAPHHLDHLYDRYYRVEDNELPGGKKIDGLGLGLYLSKAIIDAHGGQITVTSTPDVGTEFTLRVPSADPPA